MKQNVIFANQIVISKKVDFRTLCVRISRECVCVRNFDVIPHLELGKSSVVLKNIFSSIRSQFRAVLFSSKLFYRQ